jgi:futalosine hydrolase
MAPDITMSFKILYVTATSSEADALKKIKGMMSVPGGYRFGSFEISLLIGGVGSISTAWAMKQWISVNEKPDLALNAGIAGSYKDEFVIGDVVMPLSDCFADAGIEDCDNFLTMSEAGLCSADEFPFREGLLFAESRYCFQMKSLLKPVRAITVNTATGSEETRKRLLKKFNPDIETMEGATFFYICARENIPFLAVRAISNRVEPRDKSKWNIVLALDNLSEKLNEVIITLE